MMRSVRAAEVVRRATQGVWARRRTDPGSPLSAAHRTVVVSRFSPARDGIARYADQLVAHRRATEAVVTMGFEGSDANVRLPRAAALRPLRILLSSRRTDTIELMWHPEFFLAGRQPNRLVIYLGLGLLYRRRNSRLTFHEPETPFPVQRSGWRGLRLRSEARLRRWSWRGATTVQFHSAAEREAFLATHALQDQPQSYTALIAHGDWFTPATELSKPEARRLLAAGGGNHVFLCIGFIGEYKGFDRAIEAFIEVAPQNAALYVVGDVREGPESEPAFRDMLRAAASLDRRVELREGYPSDALFDTWLRAADTLVMPYRRSSSSGVLARGRLFGLAAILSRVGGLPEQARDGDILVSTDAELAQAIRQRAALGPISTES